MPNQEIINYIRASRNLNISDTEITTALLKKHNKEEIDEAFKFIKSSESAQSVSYLKTKLASMGNGMWDLIIIILIGIIILAASILTIGSPTSSKKLDEQRMGDFSTIENEIQHFYNSENRLPRSLIELQRYTDRSPLDIKDPQTNKQYDYISLSPTSYKLCTTWSTSKQKESDAFHPKGYYCLNYYLDNINPPEITPTIYPLPTEEITYENPIPVTIYNPSQKNLTDYQILIDLNEDNFAFDYDRDELNISDTDNNKLSYWIEEWDTDLKEAKIWIKIPKIKTKETKTIYIDLEGTNLPDGEKTFDFFDDFSNSLSKWTTNGASIISGEAVIAPTSILWNNYMWTNKLFNRTNTGYELTYDLAVNGTDSNSDEIIHGWGSQTTGVDTPNEALYYGQTWQWNTAGLDNGNWISPGISDIPEAETFYTYINQIVQKSGGLISWSGSRTSITFTGSGNDMAIKINPYKNGAKVDNIRVRKYISPEPEVTVVEPNDSISPTPTRDMQPALVGKWNFEEGKGTAVSDTSGNDNTGTIYGAIWTAGKTGTALQFNDPTDYVDVGNGESLNIINAITIEAWIKPSSITNYPSIVNNGEYNFQIGANSGDGRVVLEKQGVAYLVMARTPLFINQWYHVATTYDGTIAKIYINGKLNAQNTAANYNFNTIANTLIGYYPGGVGNFNGIIDDVRIYNYARTPDQISSDYTRD